ncbi:hypothetical protein HK102_001153 [Quaeritorhiza haematococci]|nr:hypothetical protein HK102_001153 [Quaeritorhiza haematococci]
MDHRRGRRTVNTPHHHNYSQFSFGHVESSQSVSNQHVPPRGASTGGAELQQLQAPQYGSMASVGIGVVGGSEGAGVGARLESPTRSAFLVAQVRKLHDKSDCETKLRESESAAKTLKKNLDDMHSRLSVAPKKINELEEQIRKTTEVENASSLFSIHMTNDEALRRSQNSGGDEQQPHHRPPAVAFAVAAPTTSTAPTVAFALVDFVAAPTAPAVAVGVTDCVAGPAVAAPVAEVAAVVAAMEICVVGDVAAAAADVEGHTDELYAAEVINGSAEEVLWMSLLKVLFPSQFPSSPSVRKSKMA